MNEKQHSTASVETRPHRDAEMSKVAPPPEGADVKGPRRVWVVLLVIALITLTLTIIVGYHALGPRDTLVH